MLEFNNNMNNDVKTTPHLVAYIDMLAGKEKINNDINNENLNKVRNLYNNIFKHIKNSKNYDTRYIDINIFSDNILISSKAYNETPKIIKRTIYNFFDLIQEFQYMALSQSILLRGCIDYGNLFIDNNFVWGNSLINAYNIEQKQAIVPRIIFSNSAINFIDYIDEKFPSISIWNRIPYCYDIDENIMINYIVKNNESLSKLEEIINNRNDYKIMVKINWIKNYFNNFLRSRDLESLLIEEKINFKQLKLFDDFIF